MAIAKQWRSRNTKANQSPVRHSGQVSKHKTDNNVAPYHATLFFRNGHPVRHGAGDESCWQISGHLDSLGVLGYPIVNGNTTCLDDCQEFNVEIASNLMMVEEMMNDGSGNDDCRHEDNRYGDKPMSP